MLWYLQPNHYTDGLRSTEPLTLSSPSVWESQTSFPATWKKTANYRLRHWETEDKLEHQVQGESLTTHDRPVASHGAQHRLPKLLPNQSGVKKNNVVKWEKLSVPFSILPLMWKCLTVLIKLPPLQRKQISLAAAKLKVTSCFLGVFYPFLGLLRTAALWFHYNLQETVWLWDPCQPPSKVTQTTQQVKTCNISAELSLMTGWPRAAQVFCFQRS